MLRCVLCLSVMLSLWAGALSSSVVAVDSKMHVGLTAAEFQAKFDDYKRQGYRPRMIDGYRVGNTTYYAAIFEKRGGPAIEVRHGLSHSAYQKEFDRLTGQGYRPVWIDGAGGSHATYSAIFAKTGGPALAVHHGIPLKAYQQKFDDYKQMGYQVTCVSGFEVGGQPYYAAIWAKKRGSWYSYHRLSHANYLKMFHKLTEQRFRLTHLSAYNVSKDDYYAAVFEKRTGPEWYSYRRMTAAGLKKKNDEYARTGFRPLVVTGYERSGKVNYAAIWEKAGR